MSEKLKQCPFCGKNYAETAWDECGSEYWVCEFCGAASGTARDEYGWNTRPIEDALNASIAELEAALTNARELVGMTPPPAFPEWIPVSERLPELYEKVIALAKDCMNVDWVLPKELRGVGKGAFARLYNVTHWMPLPEPPEVQE